MTERGATPVGSGQGSNIVKHVLAVGWGGLAIFSLIGFLVNKGNGPVIFSVMTVIGWVTSKIIAEMIVSIKELVDKRQ
jgi:hypothetical protein